MIFAPTTTAIEGFGFAESLTLIAKLGRLMLKFNKVAKHALVQYKTVDEYVTDNIHAIRNTLQFYPGISCMQSKLQSKALGLKQLYDFNMKHKTPDIICEADMQRWEEFFKIRYDLNLDSAHTDANLFSNEVNSNVYIPWFD